MRRDRCAIAGCLNYAAPKRDRCSAHRDTVELPSGDAEAVAFRVALDGGHYRAMLGSLADDIRLAAEESGVSNEIGVLRLVMAKLLAEETDPAKLSSGIAKIAGVIIQAQRAQHTLSGQSADTLTDAVATILEELQG